MACNETLKKKLMFGTIFVMLIMVSIIVITNVNFSKTKIRFVHISDTHSLTSHIK